MEKLEKYRNYIQKLLQERAKINRKNDDIETHLIFDTVRDRYQLLHIGWQEYDRIFDCPLYLDIKNDKIWVRQDFTDRAIADELLALGVPKEDIVLAFHAPYKRKFTGFAVE